jgi:hemolysin activation/secretion protein
MSQGANYLWEGALYPGEAGMISDWINLYYVSYDFGRVFWLISEKQTQTSLSGLFLGWRGVWHLHHLMDLISFHIDGFFQM